MTEYTVYRASDFKEFSNKSSCEAHERDLVAWQAQSNDWLTWHEGECNLLTSKLQACLQAPHGEFISTVSWQTLAVIRMRKVCEEFVAKHKNLKVI